jgi:hypothetical protein
LDYRRADRRIDVDDARGARLPLLWPLRGALVMDVGIGDTSRVAKVNSTFLPRRRGAQRGLAGAKVL